ncbi:MAG: lamin tail domain-containing protein, partial [Cumulibacter sp.]
MKRWLGGTFLRLVLAIFLAAASLNAISITNVAAAPDTPNSLIFTEIYLGDVGKSGHDYIQIYNSSSVDVLVNDICATFNDKEAFCLGSTEDYTDSYFYAGTYVLFASTDLVSDSGLSADGQFTQNMPGTNGELKIVNQSSGQTLDTIAWSSGADTTLSKLPSLKNGLVFRRSLELGEYKNTGVNNVDYEVLSPSTSLDGGGLVDIPAVACVLDSVGYFIHEIPSGYFVDSGKCVQDICPNLPDSYAVLPFGYELDTTGDCVEVDLESSKIEITELMPNPSGKDIGKEFIELHNPNSKSINLQGYVLQAKNTQYVLPDQEIKSGDYWLIDDLMSGITLPNSNGVELILLAASGAEVSRSATYQDAPDDQSWALVDSSWQWSSQPTPDKANLASKVEQKDTPAATTSLEDCGSGRYRNPETNRCRNIAATASSLVPCG